MTKNVLHLAMTTVAAGVGVGLITLLALYHAAVERERDHCSDVVHVQRHLMQAVARFDALYSTNDVPDDAIGTTLGQILEAYADIEGFGRTGEFLLGRREGKNIRLFWPLRHASGSGMLRAYSAADMEPMRRALQGQTGNALFDRGHPAIPPRGPARLLKMAFGYLVSFGFTPAFPVARHLHTTWQGRNGYSFVRVR
jgi:hypothetical protein